MVPSEYDPPLNASDMSAVTLFQSDRVLSQDAITHSLALLGTLPSADPTSSARLPAIVRVESLGIPPSRTASLLSQDIQRIAPIDANDIYAWMLGWLAVHDELPHVKISVICPATEVHIRKYTAQKFAMMRETPALYERIVKPYITALPSSQTQWVRDILEGRSEADKVLYRDTSPEYGYVLLPDMKWDLKTLDTLYLVAIASSPGIRSLRDLEKRHVDMLRNIRKEAVRAVREKWGLEPGTLRMYVHYQPSYYHFHVHIVNVEYQGLPGMMAGQAHLLDDIITVLELSPDDGPSILGRMTLTYTLGEQHGLFEQMKAAQNDVYL